MSLRTFEAVMLFLGWCLFLTLAVLYLSGCGDYEGGWDGGGTDIYPSCTSCVETANGFQCYEDFGCG